MTLMAVFQDADKCIRCNGCVISCKRTWGMVNENPGVMKVSYDQRVAIKSQKRVDMGPFLRFSCWHCTMPPCASRCPFNAIVKEETGAVSLDPTLCNPNACDHQCVTDCQRGGYPKIGVGSINYGANPKAYKCTLCHGRSGLPTAGLTTKYGQPLPTRKVAVGGVYSSSVSGAPVASVPEMAHEPACVYTCPAKAMEWDALENILHKINNEGYISWQGTPDGSVMWASKDYYIAAPKADPMVEDHISPMVADLMSGPFAKAAIVPVLIAGGLLALAARKAANASETEGSVD